MLKLPDLLRMLPKGLLPDLMRRLLQALMLL